MTDMDGRRDSVGARLLLVVGLFGPFSCRCRGCASARRRARAAATQTAAESVVAVDLSKQTAEMAAAKSVGCVQCHQGAHDPHGKDDRPARLRRLPRRRPDHRRSRSSAHVQPAVPRGLADRRPTRSGRYTLLNHESPEFVRFVNPGDLRVAHLSCGTVELPPRARCSRTA